jgi:hypothetical protein
VGDKSSGTRKRKKKKKKKPFCCVCRGPIKLPVAVNLLQQQQLFDHGISFPFFLIISQPSARSVTVTHVEIAFWLVLSLSVRVSVSYDLARYFFLGREG